MAKNEGDFSELLQAAEQLTADIDGNGELPRVERNLHQILEAGQQLWSRTSQAGAQDVKASILLGSKGVDLPRLSLKLEALSAAKTFESVEPLHDRDIQGFLKNERENAILSVIEETRKSTFQHAERLHWSNLQSEWEQEKQRILNALMGSGQEMLDISLQTEQTTLSDSISMGTRSTLDHQEMAYAKQVIFYNDKMIQGGTQPVLDALFAKAAETMDDQNVVDLWEMVHYMKEVPLKATGDPVKSRTTTALQNAFSCQARKYLEERYKKFIKTTVFSNLQKACLGGVPGTYHLVRSFLNVRIAPNTPGLEDGLVDGHPVWPMIFFCMRCGDLVAAMQAARQAGSVLGDFATILEEYTNSSEHRLSSTSETLVRLLYRRTIRATTDPYKRAVYCILGSCDVNDEHSEVATTTDDYLWLKLNQLQDDEAEIHQGDHMTFIHFQSLMLEEYGESHFSAYQQPYLYFSVLFLTGQFEAAIEFLSKIDKLRCHAVHIALALYEVNLLALPHSVQAPLLSKDPSDKTLLRRLNMVRLVMLYTRKFQATDPREALQYFYFLRNLKGTKGENLFMACVSELVLESREFDLLLGRLEPDGCRTLGLIDKFQGAQTDTQKIIELVAQDSENKGMFEDAVKLYDLGKKHEKVLELLNKLLSQVVSQPATPESHRYRFQKQAVTIAERYRTQGHTASQHITGTFYLLLDLMTFFDQYHNRKYQDALHTITTLKVIPLAQEEIEPRVNSFRNLSDDVRRNLPDVLLATMNILYTQYKQNKAGSTSSVTGQKTEDGGKDRFLVYLRKQAQTLITFAGMIPYRMPGDTNARLVQMEVLMN